MLTALTAAVVLSGQTVELSHYDALRWRNSALDLNFKQFKIDLAQALTLALEILVLADVIETITVTPTYQSLSVLAFLVVVRTIVSWTLILESEGRWPWQASAEEQTHA